MTIDEPSRDKVGSALLDNGVLYAVLTAQVANRYAIINQRASQIVSQSIVLAHYALTHPDTAVAPSSDVAKGLEAFVLNSSNFELFCDRYGGGRRRLYYVPAEPARVPDIALNGVKVIGPWETATLLTQAGYLTDPYLWPMHEKNAASYVFSDECCERREQQSQETYTIHPQVTPQDGLGADPTTAV
jgi:hypothetical protein